MLVTPEDIKDYELFNPKNERVIVLSDLRNYIETYNDCFRTIRLLDKIWNYCYFDLFIIRNKIEKKITGFNHTSFDDLEDTFEDMWNVI
jgi:hypothetical protein